LTNLKSIHFYAPSAILTHLYFSRVILVISDNYGLAVLGYHFLIPFHIKKYIKTANFSFSSFSSISIYQLAILFIRDSFSFSNVIVFVVALLNSSRRIAIFC